MGSLAEASLLLVPVSFEETSERRVNSKTDVSKCQMASERYSQDSFAQEILFSVSLWLTDCEKNSPQRHRDTETQRHRDTETQRHRDTERKSARLSKLTVDRT